MSGRPEQLFPLFAEAQTLEGVGPKTADLLAATGITTPRDLLFTLPHTGIDRSPRATLKDAVLPGSYTVIVTVGRHQPPRNKGGAYRITVEDAAIGVDLLLGDERNLGHRCSNPVLFCTLVPPYGFLRNRITTSTEEISAPAGAFGSREITSSSDGASLSRASSSQKKCG